MNNKIYQEITDKIIAQLTKGIIPWEQPWFGVLGARSFNTNEAYSFLNQLVLGSENGHFITWHQLNMLKGHLRKGSKARRVFFWNTFEKAEETDKGEKVIKKIPYLKTYTVFNANDCDGLPQRWASEKNNKPIESAEKITKDYLDREKIELKKIAVRHITMLRTISLRCQIWQISNQAKAIMALYYTKSSIPLEVKKD